MKKCTKCGEVLPLHMFGKNKRTKDKLRIWCKECVRKNNKAYRDKNKEELKKKAKVYRDKNKEERRKKNKAYYKENKEEALEYRRERVLKLTDSYIRGLLNSQGIDESLITPEIIELKRAATKVKRIIKQKSCKNSQD